MRITVIGCEILFREISWAAARSNNIIDVRFLRKGLHDVGEKEMSTALQKEIDSIDGSKSDVIVLGYGLCNNGIRGLCSKNTKLVVPRAHDCITLLMGSKNRYKEYFDSKPGTYFLSTGWIERDIPSEQQGIKTQLGLCKSFEEYKEKYGEENAKYIMEMTNSWQDSYKRLAYINMGIEDLPDYQEKAKKEALEKKWEFEKIDGDISLLKKLIDGQWPENEFLMLEPGEKIAASNDEGIVKKIK